MSYKIVTNNVPLMLDCIIYSPVRRAIRMGVRDYNTKGIIFTRRITTFVGNRNFKFMLPISPEVAELVIIDDKTGKDNVASLVSCQKSMLPIQVKSINNTNPLIADFIAFGMDFCRKAGYLMEGYYDSHKGIRIKYMRKLLRQINGKIVESKSPARIDSETGEIQINKTYFDTYTVSGRFAVLCHEFSHFYLNKNARDEMEADYNCAMIYLGLGFPRVDLLTVWSQIYDNADTDQNRARYQKFVQYVNNFQ